jgi:two-component system chemotaxis response regulator CheY
MGKTMEQIILVVDDDRTNLMYAQKILGGEYRVAAANSAAAAFRYLETHKPDLILLDLNMPEMDGIQALKKIKESHPQASVIMCSAMGQQAMVIVSIQSGAKDFIVKPFQADRVIEAVRKVVG